MPVIRKQGSATSPRPAAGETVIIAHLCNDCSAWGAGFVLAVNDLSREPHNRYRNLAKAFGAGKGKDGRIPRGLVQFIPITDQCDGTIVICNMIAQNGTSTTRPNEQLVDYKALRECLLQVFSRAARLEYNIHIPSGMGSGLAGGDQQTIHDLIKECMVEVETDSGKPVIITLWEFNDTAAKSFVPVSTAQSS